MNFKSFREYLEGCQSLESILECNFMARTIKVEEIKKQHSYTTLKQFYEKLVKDEFSWEILDNYNEIRELTQLKNFTLKSSKKELLSLVGNFDIFRDIFPLEMIKSFTLKPYYLFGTPIYDQTLRIQSDLLQIFMVFHFQRDCRFLRKIDGETYEISEVFSRIQIRDYNRSKKEIVEKYLSPEFNLKEYVYSLFEIYFPNVTWRYIGAGHYAHRIALQISELMFQVGLWELEDLDRLCSVLLEKTENLVTLEEACIKDSNKLSQNFNLELCQLVHDIKGYLSLNLLHIVYLMNDAAFERGLYGDTSLDLSHVKNIKVTNILNHICMKYLMKQHALKDNPEQYNLTNPTIVNLVDKYLILISGSKSDIYQRSLLNSTNSELEFYQLQKTGNVEFVQQAEELMGFFIELIEDITQHFEFGDYSQMLADNTVERVLLFTIMEAIEYLQAAPNQQNLYSRQLALVRANAVELILTLINITSVIKKTTAQIFANKLLLMICQDNPYSQSQVFQGMSGHLFHTLLQEDRPLIAIFNLRYILKNNPRILVTNPKIFKTIKSRYQSMLNSFFRHSFSLEKFKDTDDVEKNVGNATMLYTINNLLEEFLTFEVPDDTRMIIRDFEIEIQEMLIPILKKEIFPVVLDRDFLARSKSGTIIYESILSKVEETSRVQSTTNHPAHEGQAGSEGEDDQGIYSALIAPIPDGDMSFQSVEEGTSEPEESNRHSDEEITSAMFELAFSMIKLFNTSTQRVFFSSDYKNIHSLIVSNTDIDYLLEFKEGIEMLTEVNILKNNFAIYESNKMIGFKRADILRHSGVIFMEDSVPNDQSKIQNVMFQAMEHIPALAKLMDTTTDPSTMYVIRDHIYRGLLPLIFKYLKGTVSQCYVDNKQANIDTLHQSHQTVEGIMVRMVSCQQYLAQLTQGSLIFTQEMDEDKDSPEVRDRIDFSELLYPDLYTFRMWSRKLLIAIEDSYPPELRKYIDNYVRPTALKSKDKARLDPPYVMNPIKNSNIITKSDSVLPPKFSELQQMIQKYNDLKSSTGGEQPALRSLKQFYKESINHAWYSIDFYLCMIESQVNKNQTDIDLPIKTFFKNRCLLNCIVNLTQLVQICPEANRILHYFVSLPEEDKTTGSYLQIDQKITMVQREEVKKNKDSYRKAFSVIYYFCTIFRQFCQYKTFIDSDWEEAWKIYVTLCKFFENICRSDALYFKEFVGQFEPKIDSITHFNQRKWTLFFDFYVRNESFNNASLNWLIRSQRLEVGDKPELLRMFTHCYKTFNSFTSGPCMINQRTVYRYRGDILVGLLTRIIDDINSPFYHLQKAVIEYVESMIEGEGEIPLTEDAKKISEDVYCVTNYFSSNLTPKIMIKMILNILKRLIVFRLFEREPYRRAEVYKKLYDLKLKNRTPKEENLDNGFLKKKYLDMELLSHSSYEDPKSEITEEICELVRITSFDEIMNILKKDDQFFNHNCFEIAVKLFNLFKIFAAQSYPFKLSLDQKLETLKQYFSQKGPQKREISNEIVEECCILQILLEGKKIMEAREQEEENLNSNGEKSTSRKRLSKKEKVKQLMDQSAEIQKKIQKLQEELAGKQSDIQKILVEDYQDEIFEQENFWREQ